MDFNVKNQQNKLLEGKKRFVRSSKAVNRNSPAFKSAGIHQVANSFFSFVQSSDIMGPVIVDLSSMIIPRTVIDYTRGEDAGIETFRREVSSSANLFLMPGLYALGTGWLLNKSANKVPNLAIDKSTMDALTRAWLSSGGNTEKYFANILEAGEGLSSIGKNGESPWRPFPKHEISEYAKRLARAAENKTGQELSHELTCLKDDAVKVLQTEKKVRIFGEKGSQTEVKTLFKNAADMYQRVFRGQTDDVVKATVEKMGFRSIKKSAAGMAIATGVALSLQYLNRYMTERKTGSHAFVGLPDYQKNLKNQPGLSNEEKKQNKLKLFGAKVLSAAAMIYLVGMSFAGSINPLKAAKAFKPKQLAKTFEFSGILPSMKHMQGLYGATVVGRVFASDDGNELRETNIRDMFGYLNLLVLGGLISSGSAYALAKYKGVDLGHIFSGPELPEGGIGKKLWHVMSNMSQRTLKEIDALGLNKNAARLAKGVSNKSNFIGLAYSSIALGVLTPWINKWLTSKAVTKKEKQAKAKTEEIAKQKPDPIKEKEKYQEKFAQNKLMVEQVLGRLETYPQTSHPAGNQVSQDFFYEKFFKNKNSII